MALQERMVEDSGRVQLLNEAILTGFVIGEDSSGVPENGSRV